MGVKRQGLDDTQVVTIRGVESSSLFRKIAIGIPESSICYRVDSVSLLQRPDHPMLHLVGRHWGG